MKPPFFLQKAPLRYVVPAILTVFAALAFLYSYFVYMPLAEREIEKVELAEMEQELSYLQRNFERQLSKGQMEEVQQEISALGANPVHDLILLVDEEGRVVASARLGMVGKKAAELPGISWPDDFSRIKERPASTILVSADRRSAFGYIPVKLGASEHELRPTRTGVFMISHDMSSRKAGLRIYLERQILFLVITLGLIALVIWFLLSFWLTAPIRFLRQAAERLSSGDLTVRTGFSGRNEVAQIGRAFDSMAEKIEQARKKLEEAGERLSEAQSMALMGGFEISAGQVLLSSELCRMLLLPEDGAVMPVGAFLGMVHEEDRAKAALFLEPQAEDGSASFSCLVVDRLGGTRAMSLRLRKRSHAGQEITLGTMQDITERKAAINALKASEERFRLIFEQNQDAQLILRKDTLEIMDANPAAIALLGYCLEELTSGGPALFMDPQKLGALKEKVGALEYEAGLGVDQIGLRKRGGEDLTASLNGRVIRLGTSEVFLCTMRDQTERLRLEKETATAQARLIQANKMTSVGTLASGVAHEINNPNNFIILNSNLLMEAWKDASILLDERARERGDFMVGGMPYAEMREVMPELLGGIAEGSRRIKGIVETLKDFSRNDRDGLDGVIDVNRAVEAACALLKNQIDKHTERFEARRAPYLPPVKGSIQKIEQVVINLILNALQALPARERAVSVATYHDASAGMVVIEVSDEGMGMTRDVLDRITEPFFTTKLTSGGTGLGLSISYTIIKEHGGTLDFVSEPERGTTALLRLPVIAQGV